MFDMRFRHRAVVTLSDTFGWQHPRYIYVRPPRDPDEIEDGALAAGRIVRFWLWFIAPFAAAFVGSVLWAVGVAVFGG
jgi:hypothetical protein